MVSPGNWCISNSPPVKAGDYQGLEDFVASVGALVGMLSTMQGPSPTELRCGSHVDTLLTKLPVNFRDAFPEYCFTRGKIQSGSNRTYTLPDLAEWLERKVQTLPISRWISACPAEAPHADSRDWRLQQFPWVTTRGLTNPMHPMQQQLPYRIWKRVTGWSHTTKNTTLMPAISLPNSPTAQRWIG